MVDLNAGVSNGSLVVTAESREDPADRSHRHSQEARDAALRRGKDVARFALAAVLILVIGGVAAYFTLSPDHTNEEKLWGRTALTSLLGALAGYVIGKQDKDD